MVAEIPVTAPGKLCEGHDEASASHDCEVEEKREVEEILESPRLIKIESRSMLRIQLLDAYIHTHYPSRQSMEGLAQRASVLVFLPEIDCTDKLLGPTVEALCCAFFASRNSDPALSRRAHSCHGSSLVSLSRALAARKYRPRDVVNAILLVSLYSEAVPLQTDPQLPAWIHHHWGIIHYISTRRPSDFDLTKDFDARIPSTLRVISFYLGLAQRKDTLLHRLELLHSDGDEDMRARWFRRAASLPKLLTKVDQCLDRRPSDADVAVLWANIERFQSSLTYWFDMENQGMAKRLPLLEPELTSLDETNPISTLLMDRTVFAKYYRFNKVVKPHGFARHTMCGLIVDCTLLRLAHFYPRQHGMLLMQRRSVEEVKRDAYSRAVDLCRTVEALSLTTSPATMSMTELIIQLAHNFFREISAEKEFGWCRSILCAVKLRRTHLQNTQPPSLCRIGDLIPGIASAANYRSRKLGL